MGVTEEEQISRYGKRISKMSKYQRRELGVVEPLEDKLARAKSTKEKFLMGGEPGLKVSLHFKYPGYWDVWMDGPKDLLKALGVVVGKGKGGVLPDARSGDIGRLLGMCEETIMGDLDLLDDLEEEVKRLRRYYKRAMEKGTYV